MNKKTASLLTEYEQWVSPVPTKHHTHARDAIWIVGDTHIGSRTCDLTKLQEHCSLARKINAGVLLIGDALEAVTTSSSVTQAGAHFEQYQPRDQHPINWQVGAFCELFKDLDVIGLINGNHEERLRRQGYNVTALLADELKAKDLGVLASLRVGKTKILASHGEGAGQKHLEYRLRDWGPHHLVVGGHTHELTVRTVLQNDKTLWLIRSGSYIRQPRYAILKQYSTPPSPTGSVLVHIENGLPASVEILT